MSKHRWAGWVLAGLATIALLGACSPSATTTPVGSAASASPATVVSPTPSLPSGQSATVTVASVALRGLPFFVRASDDPDPRRCDGIVVIAATVADGLFLPQGRCWDEGAVWWETTTPGDRWIEIELAGTWALDGVIVQADNNDSYRLSYRDAASGAWVALWTVQPEGDAGMQTRPSADEAMRQTLSGIPTTAVKVEAAAGDGMYSVSEIQLFGQASAD